MRINRAAASEIAKVDRKTFESWEDGKEIRPSMKERIEGALYLIVQAPLRRSRAQVYDMTRRSA